tara:strand:- start:1691 stop:2092 length:402 start_codon:yes stop_codon:yes gene_type:complete
MSKIYKILTEKEWKNSNLLGYVKTDLDDKDGFIHCSTAKQLALTLYLYFKNEKSLFLCEIDESNLNRSEYCFEKALSDNRSEQDFPHIYGKLSIEQISKTWRLEKKAFQIPKEILIDLEENTIYSSHLSKLHK